MKCSNSAFFSTTYMCLFISLLIISCHSSPKASSQKSLIDELINVDKVNDSVIVVKLGYDAITAILTQNSIVVIDAGISNFLTKKYRNIIEKEFKNNHFAYLINTHGHHDHTGGNQVFSEATIVGHENCKTEIFETMKDQEKAKSNYLKIAKQYETKLLKLDSGSTDWITAYCQKYRYQCATNDLINGRKITAPSKTFQDYLDIKVDNVNFNMIYFGTAHSKSDILIHFPEKKLLMVGDLFSGGGNAHIQYEDNFDADRWLQVKKWITDRMNRINIVIGGHGEIMSKEDLQLFMTELK